jgi:2-polyprenyl-3-methyl-5-hydroxy-6-metoxy-1,4-benzoquinol methylase
MAVYKEYEYRTDSFNHIHQYLLKPIVDILSTRKERKILDLGCGNGWLTNYLISRGFDAYGTDASESGIAVARQKNADRFFLQDLSEEDLPAELNGIVFDTILSTEVIEHLYSPRDYFDFCKKILQRSANGELILSTPYHGYFKNVVLSLTGKMDAHYTALWDGGHIKFWSQKTLFAVLQEKGFHQMKFKGCGRVPYLWKSMIVCSKV